MTNSGWFPADCKSSSAASHERVRGAADDRLGRFAAQVLHRLGERADTGELVARFKQMATRKEKVVALAQAVEHLRRKAA